MGTIRSPVWQFFDSFVKGYFLIGIEELRELHVRFSNGWNVSLPLRRASMDAGRHNGLAHATAKSGRFTDCRRGSWSPADKRS
jgi:hypothetical protein